ncbi:MAG: sporulation protein [Ruminococcaceae bacterium]|nr:sporulation protein [Oscillospiraceae bacterium]
MKTALQMQNSEVYDILYRLGLNASSVSFFHAAYAIRIAAGQPGSVTYATKILYPAVAKEYGTNWRTVERSLRRASNTAWLSNPELLCELARHRLYSRPTASEFIAILAAYLATLDTSGNKSH